MKTNNNDIQSQLEMLCIDLLKQLEQLKNKELISEEEYMKHVKIKRAFLENKKKL